MAQNWLNKVFWWRTTPKEESEELEKLIARWESCVISIQNVLVWENPVVSFIYFASVNLVFWSIVYFEFRLYGLIFFALFTAAVFDWLRYQGFFDGCDASYAEKPTGKYRVLTVEEFCSCLRTVLNKIQSIYSRMQNLRENQPAMFCGMTCGCCLLLSVIGRAVSGVCIIYALLISVFTIPAICVRYPEYWRFLSNWFSQSGGIEEYFPDTSDDTIRILDLIEEVPCSQTTANPDAQLYPDLSSMPSYENSLDGFLDPNVDIPSPRQIDEDLSDTSDIEIHFKSKHFNGDGSSTSSGEELSKGLRFRGKMKREASSDSSESFELVSKDDL